MTNDALLIDVLRAAGHEDAANLAERLNAATGPAAAQEPVAAPTPTVPPTRQEMDRAEGARILDALPRS